MPIPPPVDLLLITWNRREYVEKTLAHLMASRSDFRLWCWDNGSEDGTADVIAALNDPRVARKHHSPENRMQREPCLWFLEESKADVAGKIDDDILLPEGWIERIAPLVRGEPTFGMLACWIYMPEDWDEAAAAHKIVEVRGTRVFRNSWVAGQSFLARRDLLRSFVMPPGAHYGFPIDQMKMTAAGIINGYPLPLLFAHNMDDPRSPHCLMNRPGGMSDQAALTARKRGFTTPQQYAEWIAEDARAVLTDPLHAQLERYRYYSDRSILGRLRRKLRAAPR
jgi:glycosyltransferase involved in cell wall biosynthesis